MNTFLTLMALSAIEASRAQSASEPHRAPGTPDGMLRGFTPPPPEFVNIQITPPPPKYRCPSSCGATADTPKRCRTCNIKMRRVGR